MTFSNRQIISNSIWMMSEKIIYLLGLVFVTAFVARYIGPENFGKLTFVTSIFAIVQTVCMFGLENVIFQKISKNRYFGQIVMAASVKVRKILFYSISPLLLLYLYLTSDNLTFVFAISTCIATYFTLTDVYSIYFNAILDSKVNMVYNSIGLVIALCLRFIVPYLELEYYWFSVSIISMTFIPYMLRSRYYNKNRLPYSKEQLKKYRKYLFRIGRKLVIYSLSTALYIQCSQIFLGLYSIADLGFFSVAYTLSYSFYFVLMAVASSFMVKIYSEQDLNQSQNLMAKLNWIVIFLSLCALLFFLVSGEWIILSLYGEDYMEAANILYLLVLACCLSGLTTIVEKYLFKFNAYNYLYVRSIILSVFNIVISYLLISLWGLYGAVISILCLHLVSAFIYNYIMVFEKNTVLNIYSKMFLFKENKV